jgi:glyoxylase-like metal-dependent hydrolase (beta-lactamase superfamily II)
MPSTHQTKKFTSCDGVRIYQIPCQVFDSLMARVYLLLGAGDATLVDAGSGAEMSVRQILGGVQSVRDEFGEPIHARDIRRIFITHGHIDHIGGLPELLRHTNAGVFVHALDRTALSDPRQHATINIGRLDAFLRRSGVAPEKRATLLRISPTGSKLESPLPVESPLDEGGDFDGIHVVHTPGHSPGHVCIRVGNVLLSGDHILARTLPHLWTESTAAYTGLGHYLDSLDKIYRIPGIELTLPAHEQVIHDIYRRIDAIRATHARRLERLIEVVRDAGRPLTLYEIVERSYPQLTGFRAVLAVTDIGSRVEYLHQRGVLAVENLDEIEGRPDVVHRYVVR